MNKVLTFIFLFALSVLFLTCREVHDISKEYPLIATRDAEVTQHGVRFTGEVINWGEENIVAFGFVWQETPKPTIENDIYIIVDSDNITKKFQLDVNNGWPSSNDYYLRAFVKTSEKVIYGNEVKFTSRRSQTPLISRFYPSEGISGSTITIEGANFSTAHRGNTVRFGEMEAKIFSISANKLLVSVPVFSETSDHEIELETGKVKLTAPEKFTVWAPWTFLGTHSSLLPSSTQRLSHGAIGYAIGYNNNHVHRYDMESHSWSFLALPENSGTLVRFTKVGNTSYALFNQNFCEFDLYSESWSKKASYPAERINSDHMIDIGGDALMLMTGSATREVWRYKADIDTWKRINDFPGWNQTLVGDPRAFSHFIDGYAYLGLTHRQHSEFWKFNPDIESWTYLGDIPAEFFYHRASFEINGKIYLGLGVNLSGIYRIRNNQMWEYDPVSNKWVMLNNCTVSLTVSTVFIHNDKAIIFSSDAGSNHSRQVWEFDPRFKLIPDGF